MPGRLSRAQRGADHHRLLRREGDVHHPAHQRRVYARADSFPHQAVEIMSAAEKPKGWRLRFGLFSLLLSMTLLAVAAAVLGHLLRQGADSTSTGIFVVLAAGAPMALMIVASALAMLSERRRRPPDD